MLAEADGARSYPSLASVPEPIDVVDVFGNPIDLDEVVDEAIAAGANVLAAGLQMVSNRGVRTEHERLKIPAKQS